MFSLIAQQFNWYGFFIGLAIVVVLEIFQKKLKSFYSKNNLFLENNFWKLVVVVLASGMLGGRLWYVMTDWQNLRLENFNGFYDFYKVLAFWEGGMSILGAVLFGFFGLWWAQKKWFPKLSLLSLTDSLVLGLPLGQAIGRLGNWANQELYGLPTNLPWRIYIRLENRLAPFLNEAYFHPLFAYEALLMLGVFGGLWWLLKNKKAKLGDGKLTVFYLIAYSVIRFLLDFIRVQKTLWAFGLGVNQILILLLWALGLMFLFLKKYFWGRQIGKQKKKLAIKIFFIGLVTAICLGALSISLLTEIKNGLKRQELLYLPDHSIVDFEVNAGWGRGQKLKVEVVNTPESITRGLSDRETLGEYQGEDRKIDGMLFVFPQKGKPVFWMKDMNFKIDIVWLDNNKIIGIERNASFPLSEEKQENLLKYSPNRDINLVLETEPFFLLYPPD